VTPRLTASLLASAKRMALPVATCVHNRVRPAHILRDKSWAELYALVIVLAEAADLAAVFEVANMPDGGPEEAARAAVLRKAHAKAEACRKMRRPVPGHLAVLEREYWRWRKREQQHAARAGKRSRAA
jgi:hypothetical protein